MFLNYIKRNLLGALVVSVVATVALAYATTGAVFDIVNRAYFVATSGNKMTIGTAGSDTFTLLAAGTPVAYVDSGGISMAAGKTNKLSVNSVTFKATPTPGTDLLVSGYNVPAGTPTASTIARLPATPTPGDVVEFYNSSTTTLKIQAGGAATINGAGTNGTIAVATLISATCRASSASNWDCRLNVNPTPAA